jgi:hypothetical protein
MSSLFTCPKARFPVTLDSSSKTALYSELHRLRSLVPLTSPFAIDSSCPLSTAVTLLGFFPSKAFSDHASKPRTRPSHKDSNTRLSPKSPRDLRPGLATERTSKIP